MRGASAPGCVTPVPGVDSEAPPPSSLCTSVLLSSASDW